MEEEEKSCLHWYIYIDFTQQKKNSMKYLTTLFSSKKLKWHIEVHFYEIVFAYSYISHSLLIYFRNNNQLNIRYTDKKSIFQENIQAEISEFGKIFTNKKTCWYISNFLWKQ